MILPTFNAMVHRRVIRIQKIAFINIFFNHSMSSLPNGWGFFLIARVIFARA
jgi:hypothetical protein